MTDINNKAEARQKLAALFKQDAGKPGTLSGAGVASIAGGLLGARDGHIGALRGETSITIQTRQAQILLTGSQRRQAQDHGADAVQHLPVADRGGGQTG